MERIPGTSAAMRFGLIVAYLSAIVAANLLIVRFGPGMTIVNAFLFIGLDLVARDRLHEAWHHRGLILKMALLIAAGSLLSWLLNRDSGRIAIASFVAFALAAVADAVVYWFAMRRWWSWFRRSNGSNVVSAAVDSLIFPTLAFGTFAWSITLGQFAAKIIGGLVWSAILRPRGREEA